MSAAREKILQYIDSRKDELAAIADELYRNPETGLQEHRTSAFLCGILAAGGFELQRSVCGLETSFLASYGTAGPGIAILAEMDALPELGHACGHNIGAAAAMGAALALRHALPADALRLCVFGTPAEESGIGKVELVNQGAFAGMDFAMMVHPSSRRYVMKNFLGLARVRFTFFGKAAHASAHPEEGINALDAVIQTFNSVNALRQQLRQDVRVHGIITEGGTLPNIIPEKSSCYFYCRAETLPEVIRVRDRVIACAEGAALATGCTLQVEEDKRVLAPMKINRAFSALYSSQLASLGLPESAVLPDRNRGSSDIGNVSQVVPTIHPHVPIGAGLRIHTPDFARATVSAMGKEAVLEGARAMALTAVELARSLEIRKKITEEFRLG